MLSPRWMKVARDLLGHKSRTIIVVLSIAVGVFAIGMIGGTNVALTDDMSAAYQRINPASGTVSSQPFGEAVVEAVRGMREVELAEGRWALSFRVISPDGQKRPLNLTAVGDFDEIRIGKIFPQSGQFAPGERQVVLERASAAYLGFDVGDTLTLDWGEGKTKRLRVVGTVHDINNPPAMFVGGGFGYIAMSTLEWLGASRDFNQLDFVVAENKADVGHIEAVAAEVRKKIEASGRTVYYTYVPQPGKHPASDMMQAITYLLGALGFVAMLLSGFLVANTISALLTQQTRQIGVMKAVGARAGQLAGMYLVMVLAYGFLALTVGIPLGALGAYLMGGFMANMVNFDVASFAPTVHILALELAVGLGVPLLAALIPLISGVRVTAREAMSTHGTGKAVLGNGIIDRALERVRGVSRPVLLSLRNTFRRKGRLALTLTTLTLAGATFVAVFSVRDSTVASLDEALAYFNYDLQVSFGKAYRSAFVESETLRVPGVVAVESVAGASLRPVRADGTEGGNVYMLALHAETEMIEPILLEGRWLLPEDGNAVVVNTAVLQNEPGIKVGDTVTFGGSGRETKWVVVGIARSVMTGPIAYANRPYFERAMRSVGRTSQIWVRTEQRDAAGRAATIAALTAQFKESGIRVGDISAMADQRDLIQSQFDMLVIFLLIMAAIMAVVGGLGLMGTMSLNVLERTREIGVMRAIGASDWAVRQVFLVEGILIGVISWLVGAVAAVPISQLLSYTVGLSLLQAPLTYAFSFFGTLIWLAVVVILSVVASIIPARSASRLSVREVLAYE